MFDHPGQTIAAGRLVAALGAERFGGEGGGVGGDKGLLARGRGWGGRRPDGGGSEVGGWGCGGSRSARRSGRGTARSARSRARARGPAALRRALRRPLRNRPRSCPNR